MKATLSQVENPRVDKLTESVIADVVVDLDAGAAETELSKFETLVKLFFGIHFYEICNVLFSEVNSKTLEINVLFNLNMYAFYVQSES